MREDSPWAIVLAAGEGARLRALTTNRQGRSVPKQFCSLAGGRTLFAEALDRACSIVGEKRVVTIVAEEHRDLFESEVQRFPRRNVIIQPQNRGTAAGVLLPLRRVLAQSPAARIVIIPSDHFVADEPVLRASILEALAAIRGNPRDIVLLGITPETAVSDYGWILPEADATRLQRIERFVEKPAPRICAGLLSQGGLWNSFLIAAQGTSLLDLYTRRLPDLVTAFRMFDDPGPEPNQEALQNLYERIDVHDFSRDLLEGSEECLRVFNVPSCGWTDLGTPQRVMECLRTSRTIPPTIGDAEPRPVLARALRELGYVAR